MSNNILLVEGKNDEHVVRNLLDCHVLPQIDTINNHGGISNLLKDLPVHLKGSDINALGIIVDADTDMLARWSSLRDSLIKAGYATVPDLPSPEGTILLPPPNTLLPKKVGIWMMPDNQSNGILEDFLRLLIPTSNTLLHHAEKSIDSIPEGHRLFAEKDKSKALIHTWLAWQENPGLPFGTAIKAQYLKAKVATNLINWLKKLFFS